MKNNVDSGISNFWSGVIVIGAVIAWLLLRGLEVKWLIGLFD